MKRRFLLSLLMAGIVFSYVLASNPIPSYNIPVVHKADFLEKNKGTGNYRNESKGKRDMEIIITCLPGHSGTANVWVYSLDGLDTYGPYQVGCGEHLTVQIDDRDWGVTVESEEHVIVDVFIDAGGDHFPRMGRNNLPPTGSCSDPVQLLCLLMPDWQNR